MSSPLLGCGIEAVEKSHQKPCDRGSHTCADQDLGGEIIWCGFLHISRPCCWEGGAFCPWGWHCGWRGWSHGVTVSFPSKAFKFNSTLSVLVVMSKCQNSCTAFRRQWSSLTPGVKEMQVVTTKCLTKDTCTIWL